MEVQLADLIDRITIVRLKLERIGNPIFKDELLKCEQAIEEFKKKGIIIKNKWFDQLYGVNGEEWDFLSKIYDEKRGKCNLEKIGKLYLDTENLNKKRMEIKNKIVKETHTGFLEIKANHVSA